MSRKSDLIITKVKTWSENLELSKPYDIAYRTIETVENVFVYLESKNKLWGIGAGSPAKFVTGESIEDAKSALQEKLEKMLLGKDFRYIRQLCRLLEKEMFTTPAARKAADIALHDILAKYLELPMVDMLGRVYNSLPTSITIGIKPTIEETLDEADAYIKQGFKIIKLKIGKSVEQDIETTHKLREKVGKKIGIRVDANQGYKVEDLINYFRQTKDLNIELIEQPVNKEKPEEMLKVPEEIRRCSAADEAMQTTADAFSLAIPPHSFGIFNIKLTKCGGIYPALGIADIARHAGIELMWGCMDESIVSISAALHAALACPATKYIDLDGSFDLARDIVTGGFILKDGLMSISDQSGLGVQLKKLF